MAVAFNGVWKWQGGKNVNRFMWSLMSFSKNLVAFELTAAPANDQQQIVAHYKSELALFVCYLFANEVPHTFLGGGSVLTSTPLINSLQRVFIKQVINSLL